MNDAIQSGTVVQGDVRRVLAAWPDDCADLIIADPGYGMGKADWDRVPDFGPWIAEALRVLKTTGTLYIFGLPEAVAKNWASFPAPKQLLTWSVSNRVSPKCRTWQSTQESIVMLTKGRPFFDRNAVREPYSAASERLRGKPRPSTPGRFGNSATRYSDAPGALPRDVIRGPGLSGKVGARESLGHPCQKPLWLMEKLVKASCPPGGLVLDLFAGVATTSTAAQRLGRQWIAVERDPKWCQVALDRLTKEGAQAGLAKETTADLSTWRSKMEEEVSCLRKMVTQLQQEAAGRQPPAP